MLRKLCREEEGLYLLVDEADPPRQRESLSRQVAGELATIAIPYPTWDAFLEHLRGVGRRFVVLDEFQRLLLTDPQAVSRLQHHWDTALRETGPSLVLCGSSVGMMQRVTARRTAPLFGRLAADLRLRPFGYGAVRLLYPDEAEDERVRRYAVFGGTPYYHQFSVGRSLEEAVRDAFLAPTAPMIEEPQNLLRLELQSPTRHNSILFEIGQGTHDLRGLEAKVGVRTGGLGPYLETLRHELDLVRMDGPVCGKRRPARYAFTDPFFSFYYRVIFENRPRLEMGRANAVWDSIESNLDGHVGHHFEAIAREALTLLNGSSWKGIPVDFDEIGPWWNRQGEEIDIIAAGGREVLAGEVSWFSKPTGLGVLRRLEGKVRLVEQTHGRPIRFALVSRGGFAPDVLKEAGERGVLLLDFSDLAVVFDARFGKPQPR
jgi:AAA+ ATPase superfamily predicted ATPase